MEVTKTLVVGLGSTGTEICEAIARRIQWELGSISRAPWIQFLCIETDGNNRPDVIAYEDFIPLTISAEEYQMLLNKPDAYDEKIRFTEWAEIETLKNLHDGHVTAGAGNIRMVGRLAFFFPSNYDSIHSALILRLNRLRQLTVADVQEKHGTMPDGQMPQIQFANNGNLVIYVVGTLCGGTCSGLASDFGFFLNRDTQPSEHKIGIFTLPHRSLTSTTQKSAERFKRNAYAALVELNQYHLTDRADGKTIRFPDGRESSPSEAPYSLLFIAAPRHVGTEHNQQLNTAIADYIFLNAFVPSTLPLADAINAPPILDRGNQAHVFCTFGLSTLEFPAQRVIEACTLRLSAYALGQWCHRSVEENTIEEWLDNIGLTWERLKDLLFRVNDKDVREEATKQPLDEAMRKVWRRTNDARQIINNSLRPLFQQSDVADELSLHSPGSLYQVAMRNRQAVANQIVNNIRNRISSLMADYRRGPAVVRQFLTAIERRLDELNEQASTIGELPREVDTTLRDLERYRSGWLNRFLGKSKVKILIGHLYNALRDELDAREDMVIARAISDRVTEDGITDIGVISRIRRERGLFQRRTVNLLDRLVTLQNRMNHQSNELSRHEPNINGVLLFDPETGGQGTVPEEFRRCLELDAVATGVSWEEHREKIASEMISGVLSRLSGHVTLPSTAPHEQDWLSQPLDTSKPPTTWLPGEIFSEMLERARAPFLRLRNENVLERWMNTHGSKSPEAMAEQAAEKATSFLDLNETHATFGGRSPILRNRLLLVPESTHRQKFENIAQHHFANPKVDTSPDSWRVVFVQNLFRFPLRGVLSVVGADGISRAHCDDFPTFFTRKDVAWVGVTDEEDKRVRKAEEILTIATLLEIVRPEGGALVFDLRTGPGDPGIRRLPLSFRHAAMALARGEIDTEGYGLHQALEILEARIQTKRNELKTAGGDVRFVQHIDEQLQRHVGGVVPDWNRNWLAERFSRYCAADNELLKAYDQVFPPDRDMIKQMTFKKGDRRPGQAGICEQDGIYCTKCGGWIGKDEQEAAQNGWRCFVNPQNHYFGFGAIIAGGQQ
jgi:hypothetical protein